MILLDGSSLSLSDLMAIAHDHTRVGLTAEARGRVRAARALVDAKATAEEPSYGINTGFGKLASVRIAAEDVETLQRNLILSHCCGVGQPLPAEIVRLIMALKLISLGAARRA